ncbi:MAG TPA: VWA domain-containing protein [Blastocatellia bacterium]|nr:VWA domain-containing protein [Blastocatellia bacterium]
MKYLSLLCLISLLAPGLSQPGGIAALAGQNSQDEPIKLRSELVQVDLIVLDRSGRPVKDLKEQDFILTEDGKQQSISFFSLLASPRPDAAAGAPGQAGAGPSATQPGIPPGTGRTIFLIFDPYFISFDSYPRLRTGLQGFIADNLDPQDQLAIINLSGGAAVFQHASANKEVVSLALDAMLRTGSKNSETSPASSLASAIQGDALGSLRSSAGDKNQLMERDYRLKNTLRSLASISKNLGEVPGRKIAIFVSEYFPVYLDPAHLSDGEPNRTNYSNELREIIGRARRGGLVFYTLDPQGLAANDIPGGTAATHQPASMFGGRKAPEESFKNLDTLRMNREGLRYIAEATGGQSILNTNDFKAGLDRIIRENEAVYVLAYYPTNSTEDGRFRRVKIQVKGRPDLTVRTRQGYLARGKRDDDRKQQSKEELLSNAVSRLAPIRNIMVGLTHSTTAPNKAEVVVRIAPEPGLFKRQGGLHRASFEIAGFIFDLQNKQVDGFSKTVKLELSEANYSRLMSSGMTVPVEIELKKPGLYNLRVAVLEPESGEIGTASDWVEAK